MYNARFLSLALRYKWLTTHLKETSLVKDSNVSNKQPEYRWVRAGVRMSQGEYRYAAGHTPEWRVVHLKKNLTCI